MIIISQPGVGQIAGFPWGLGMLSILLVESNSKNLQINLGFYLDPCSKFPSLPLPKIVNSLMGSANEPNRVCHFPKFVSDFL